MERSELENNQLLKDMIKRQYEGKEGTKEGIWYEKFQTKTITCNITGETCQEGECCIGCKIAENYVLEELYDDLLRLFPVEDSYLNGVKVKRNWKNNLCEFKSLDSFRKVFKTGASWFDKMVSIPELSDEIKAEYPVWMECSEIISELYPITGYMYLKDFPLVVVCEDRLFASTPVVEGLREDC